MNKIHKLSGSVIMITMLVLSACSTTSIAGRNTKIENEYLVYVISDLGDAHGEGHLVLYEPNKDVHTPILPEWIVRISTLNEKGGLAFSSSREGNSEVYILKYPFVDNTPTNITNNASSEDRPLSWSPDGRYLAFESARADGKTLKIWDGKTVLSIYEYKHLYRFPEWDSNDRLAFTDSEKGVFVWDGRATTNVSRWGGDFRWSADGRLAFSSYRDGQFDIYVWDGISFIKGEPDKNTYVNVAPDLTDGSSSPLWTSTGSLMFDTQEWHDGYQQKYEWDGQVVTKLCNTNKPENTAQNWDLIQQWFFLTDCSANNPSYVRNKENQPWLILKDRYLFLYTGTWSSSGLFLICARPDKSSYEFTLSIWNGTNVVDVARGPEIRATWKNGNEIFCSSG